MEEAIAMAASKHESGEGEEMSDEAIQQLQVQRFQQRLQRVLEVMRQERIDWRGLPFLTPDGRVAARVVPVEMVEP